MIKTSLTVASYKPGDDNRFSKLKAIFYFLIAFKANNKKITQHFLFAIILELCKTGSVASYNFDIVAELENTVIVVTLF